MHAALRLVAGWLPAISAALMAPAEDAAIQAGSTPCS
jgi:hypothetical protein